MAKSKARIVINYFNISMCASPGYSWGLLDENGPTYLHGPTRKTYKEAKKDARRAKRLMAKAVVEG